MDKKTFNAGLIISLLLLSFWSGCAGKPPQATPTTQKIQGTIPTTSTNNTTSSIWETTTTAATPVETISTFAPDCKDSDRRNIYLNGSVSGYGGMQSSAYTHNDVCVNETTVLEYFCYSDGGYLKEASEEISCPGSGKCSDGACVPLTGTVNVLPLTGGEYVTGLSENGFLASYGKYKFRVDGFLYHQDSISGITLDVMRPDATIIKVQASETMSGVIESDSLEIFFPGDPASIYVRTAVENPPSPEAVLLTGISDKGFSEGYAGYKFKIDRFIHSKESDILGIKLFVQRPDGAIISPEVSLDSYIKVDKILVMLPSSHSMETSDEKRADIYVWLSTGGESEKVDLTGIGVALMNWNRFIPNVTSVKYTETGKYETVVKNAFGVDIYVESIGAQELKSGQGCGLIRVNSLPVDKGSALDIKSGDSFRITAQCPRKASDERYNMQLQIDYYSFVDGVKKSFNETGEIKGIAEL
jgi:hypothetical protein